MKLKNKIYILDGPMGTEIDRRGGDTSLPLWSARALMDQPELVFQIHSDYVTAGADIITTNTFRTQPWTLQKVGFSETKARELTLLAVDLALESCKFNQKCLIAGSIPPLEDCYSPWLVPSDAIIKTEQAKHIKNLVDGGIDIFLIETMNSLRESLITFELTKEYPDIPVILSFTCGEDGLILSGDPWDKIANTFKEGIETLSINCSSAEGSEKAITEVKNLGVNCWGCYPNFGYVQDQIWFKDQNKDKNNKIHKFISHLVSEGPKLIGTCCGAVPEDTMRIKKLIR